MCVLTHNLHASTHTYIDWYIRNVYAPNVVTRNFKMSVFVLTNTITNTHAVIDRNFKIVYAFIGLEVNATIGETQT